MKLYIVVKSALSAGLKAAQAVHAALLFGEQYPHLKNYWYHESNNIVVLQDQDLEELSKELEGRNFRLVKFHEPDLDNALTAIAVEPAAKNYLRRLSLAGG